MWRTRPARILSDGVRFMNNTFDNWQGEYLEHHGIPGMKWGVRRYQNEDGSLTAAGKSRYGFGEGDGRKSSSARKMQRDFNNLDKGYANVAAEKNAANNQLNRRLNKTMKYAQKKGYADDLEGNRGRSKRLNKLMTKTEKSLLNTAKYAKQMKEIEALQLKIIAKAAENGYTVKSKPVIRLGNTGKQRALSILSALAVGGGALPGAIIGGLSGATALKVDGQRVKIRKDGDGTQQLVNYHDLNERERKNNKGR